MIRGTNLEDVLEMNRSAVITLIRQRGEVTRAELAKATGLRQVTIDH